MFAYILIVLLANNYDLNFLCSLYSHVFQYIKEKIQEGNETSCEMEMLQKFTDLTLDVIGVCAFGYDFDGILGEGSEEAAATNTILTANFNVVRKVFEEIFPLLKLTPSKERDALWKAEDILYGLINKVCEHYMKFTSCHDYACDSTASEIIAYSC